MELLENSSDFHWRRTLVKSFIVLCSWHVDEQRCLHSEMFFYLTRDTADGLTIQLSYHYSDRQEVMSITEAKFLFWCFLQREVGGF